MREDRRRRREEEIERAAYALLEENGYEGTSMLAIARRARASNETLYAWYGDKRTLFAALVARNAAEVKDLLHEGDGGTANPLDILKRLGPSLLRLVCGNRAVALNRAAAADPSGELGEAIARAGRESVLPRLAGLLEAARRDGLLAFADADDAAELYLALLIGDLQIRRVIARLPEPDEAETERRAGLALDRLCRLLAPRA